jgi:O-antigen ligase
MLEPRLASIVGDSRPSVHRPDLVRSPVIPAPRWDLLSSALAVYLLAAVARVHQLFPILNSLKPLLLSSAVALLLYFVVPPSDARRRPGLVLRTRPMLWMIGVLGWAILSIPGALWIGGAFDTAVNTLLKAVLMAVVLAGSVRGLADVERLCAVYFGGIALYSAVILTRFSVGGDAWRLSGLYYYDANDFATIAVSALPIGLYFVLRRGRPVLRAAAGAGLVMTGVAFIWTGSRGGFLAALAVGVYILTAYSTIPFRWRLMATVSGSLLFAATASDTYWDKMQSIVHLREDYNVQSEEGRMAIWGRGLGYMLGHPILGVGAGNFPTAEGTISPQVVRQSTGHGIKWGAAHNTYVQVGAELGIPGLILFLGMLGAAFRGVATIRRRPPSGRPTDPHLRPLAQALTGALIGFSVGAFFLSLAYTDALYLLVALAAGLRRSVTS